MLTNRKEPTRRLSRLLCRIRHGHHYGQPKGDPRNSRILISECLLLCGEVAKIALDDPAEPLVWLPEVEEWLTPKIVEPEQFRRSA